MTYQEAFVKIALLAFIRYMPEDQRQLLRDQTTAQVLDIGHNVFIPFQKPKIMTTQDPPGRWLQNNWLLLWDLSLLKVSFIRRQSCLLILFK